MSRTKGMAKGETDPFHGSVDPKVKKFLDDFRKGLAVFRETRRAVQRRAMSKADAISWQMQVATSLLDDIGENLYSRNSDFFVSLSQRLKSASPDQPVDPEGFEILGIWSVTTNPIDPQKTPRESLNFTELLRELESFGVVGSTRSAKRLREKAKKLGVRFGKSGRPSSKKSGR